MAEITKRILEEKRTAYIKSLPKRLDTLITNFDKLKQGNLRGFNIVERRFKSLTLDYSNLFNEKFSSSIAEGKFKSQIAKLSKVRKSAWQVANHSNATDYAP